MRGIFVGFVLFLAFLPFSVSADTYYVDATGGNDNNNGTSPLSAWQTLSKVNGYSFSPGDTIYFKRDCNWTGGLVIDDSGNQDNPITFTAYGTGEKPIFRNPGDLITLTKSILINADWVVVDGLLARDAFYGGVWISNGADHNIVRNCEATNVGFGFAVFGQYNLITQNYAHDLNMIINTPGGDDDFGAVGVQVGNSNNEVSYNTMIDCIAPSYDYGTDGGAVEFFGTVDNCSIHHNWATGCDGFFEAGGGSVRNTTLAYNVGVNNSVFFWIHTTGGFASVLDDFNVHHNTIVESEDLEEFDWSLFGFSGSTYTDECFLRNNIFYVNDYWFVSAADNRGWNFNHEYNLYYMPDPRTSPGFSLGNGEIIANPLFEDTTINDFHLQEESPAIDAGIDLGYFLDFEDNLLPVDGDNNGSAEYDMGAYEYFPSTCTGTCKPNPCDSYDDCANASGECSSGYYCCSGVACIACGDTYCDFPEENCTSCLSDCDCSPQLCCNGVCTTPICSHNFHCDSDPCKIYMCNNPGTCSASCSSQDKTSCEDGDNCCPAGCDKGNDNDCIGLGPIALYHFDEGEGNISGDSSGNGNDGAINGANWTNDSVSGYALSFDGSDDYVEIDTTDFPTRGPFTVSIWLNKTTSWAAQAAVSRWSDNNQVFEFQTGLGSPGKFIFLARTSDASAFSASIDTAQLNEWYHVVGVADGNTASLYVNGVKYNGSDMSWNAGEPSGVVRIGMRSDGNYPFEGLVDEVRIYNRTLTQEEILNLYSNPGGEAVPGDLNNDGSVDIFDLDIIAIHFGQTESHQDWNATADVVPNNEIDVFDVVFVASRFM